MIDTAAITHALQAAETPLLLETTEQMVDASREWKEHEVLGVDTEFLRERTYRAELGLVQVSDGRKAWLVDTKSVEDLGPLRKLLTNASVLKVFHSASEDLEVLWHTLDVCPRPMADTQIACALLGQPLQTSYPHAVKWLTGVDVDKEQTRSNWLRRPLRPEQLHYAATDVVFLPAMMRELRGALQLRGRWRWLEEDVARMSENCQTEEDADRAYLRFKGAGHLDISSLQVLRALASWRERTARSRNLARGFVVSDAALLQLAKKKPRNDSELDSVADLHPRAAGRYGNVLLATINQHRDSTAPIERLLPLDAQQRRKLEAMRRLVQKEAHVLQVDPAILASKKQLEALMREYESEGTVPDRLSGWREPVITRKLLPLISGPGTAQR